jgi:hypothetical protein
MKAAGHKKDWWVILGTLAGVLGTACTVLAFFGLDTFFGLNSGKSSGATDPDKGVPGINQPVGPLPTALPATTGGAQRPVTVRRSGTVTITQGGVDLDSTKPDWDVKNTAAWDIYWMDIAGLLADGQALAAVQDPSPSYQTCASATNYVQSVKSVSEGDAFCVRTGAGRMSLLKVASVTAPAGGSGFTVGGTALALNVTTWEK